MAEQPTRRDQVPNPWTHAVGFYVHLFLLACVARLLYRAATGHSGYEDWIVLSASALFLIDLFVALGSLVRMVRSALSSRSFRLLLAASSLVAGALALLDLVLFLFATGFPLSRGARFFVTFGDIKVAFAVLLGTCALSLGYALVAFYVAWVMFWSSDEDIRNKSLWAGLLEQRDDDVPFT